MVGLSVAVARTVSKIWAIMFIYVAYYALRPVDG